MDIPVSRALSPSGTETVPVDANPPLPLPQPQAISPSFPAVPSWNPNFHPEIQSRLKPSQGHSNNVPTQLWATSPQEADRCLWWWVALRVGGVAMALSPPQPALQRPGTEGALGSGAPCLMALGPGDFLPRCGPRPGVSVGRDFAE